MNQLQLQLESRQNLLNPEQKIQSLLGEFQVEIFDKLSNLREVCQEITRGCDKDKETLFQYSEQVSQIQDAEVEYEQIKKLFDCSSSVILKAGNNADSYVKGCKQVKAKFEHIQDQMENEFSKISAYISELNGSIKKEINSLQNLNQENSYLQDRIDEQNKKIDSLSNQIYKYEQKIENQKIKVRSLVNDKSTVQKKNEKISIQIQELKQKSDRNDQLVKQSQSRVYSIKDSKEKIRNKILNCKKYIQDNKILKNQQIQKKKEFQEQLNELMNKKKELQASAKKKVILGGAVALAGTFLSGGTSLLVYGAGLGTQLNGLMDQSDASSLVSRIDEIQDEINSSTQSLASYEREINQFQSDLVDNEIEFQEANNNLTKELNKQSEYKEKQQQFHDQNRRLADQEAEIKGQINKLENEIDQLNSAISSTKSSLRFSEQRLDNLEEKYQINVEKEEKLNAQIKLKTQIIKDLEKLQVPEEKQKYLSCVQMGISQVSKLINQVQSQFFQVGSEFQTLTDIVKQTQHQLIAQSENPNGQSYQHILRKAQRVIIASQESLNSVKTQFQLLTGTVNIQQIQASCLQIKY